MRKIPLLLLLIAFIGLETTFAQTFTLKSSTLSGQAEAETYFNQFGCTGENISPQLSWENPPEGTKSFAITVYDPDAPTGSGFWHWQIFDIPTETNSIAKGASGMADKLPKGVIEGKNDYGAIGFGGACPPVGDRPHQYIVTVHALKVDKLGIDASASAAVVGFYLNANVIEKASLVFYAKRE